MKTLNEQLNPSQFDQVIYNRLLADDFAQPKLEDFTFYKAKAYKQIELAIQAIQNATNQSDFSSAISQANAFLDAAMDYEFIDLCEKSQWLDQIAAAVRIQTIGESA